MRCVNCCVGTRAQKLPRRSPQCCLWDTELLSTLLASYSDVRPSATLCQGHLRKQSARSNPQRGMTQQTTSLVTCRYKQTHYSVRDLESVSSSSTTRRIPQRLEGRWSAYMHMLTIGRPRKENREPLCIGPGYVVVCWRLHNHVLYVHAQPWSLWAQYCSKSRT